MLKNELLFEKKDIETESSYDYTSKVVRIYQTRIFKNQFESVYVEGRFTLGDNGKCENIIFTFLDKGEMKFDMKLEKWYILDMSLVTDENFYDEYSGYIWYEATEFEKEVCRYLESDEAKNERWFLKY